MCFTILGEIKSTLPKSQFCNYYSQIKSNQMLAFDERGKPEYPGKNLSWQSRERTNSIHVWHRVRKLNPGHFGGRQVLSPLGQPCHKGQPATNVFVAGQFDRARWKTGNIDKNLQRNNVARQVEGFCISYFAALRPLLFMFSCSIILSSLPQRRSCFISPFVKSYFL